VKSGHSCVDLKCRLSGKENDDKKEKEKEEKEKKK